MLPRARTVATTMVGYMEASSELFLKICTLSHTSEVSPLECYLQTVFAQSVYWVSRRDLGAPGDHPTKPIRIRLLHRIVKASSSHLQPIPDHFVTPPSF